MGRRVLTLEELLKRVPDCTLMDIEEELFDEVIPATGATHDLCRKLNKMIDDGDLCINPTQYRRIYTPALSKAVHKECARRYVRSLTTGRVTTDASYEQLTLNL